LANHPDSRRRVSQEAWVSRLSTVWDVGLLVLGRDLEVDYANARARELLVAKSEADLERRWRQLRSRLGKALDESKEGRPVEVTVNGQGGSRGHSLRLQIFAIEEEECVGHLLVLQPAERAAAIEAALRHAAHSRSLASLFRDLAHDLKGLLNVIAMNVEILSRLPESDADFSHRPGVAAKSADAVRRELARLDRSLEVILDRDASGREKPGRFDVRHTCRALADLIAARASRQHVKLVVTLGTEPAEIMGFSDRVHGAVLNLLINALDAMPEGGILQLDVTRTASIRVSVCDSGAGIDPKIVDRIWSLHYSSKPAGTGIGLYVTRAVVEAHGGRVSCHRNQDGGACFALEFPVAPATETGRT
jgi:signal transduction histidine kinase